MVLLFHYHRQQQRLLMWLMHNSWLFAENYSGEAW